MSPRKIPHSRTAVVVAAMVFTLFVPCTSAFAISSSTLRVLSGQAASTEAATTPRWTSRDRSRTSPADRSPMRFPAW